MQDQHCTARRRPGHPDGINSQAFCRRAVPIDFLLVRPGVDQGAARQLLQRTAANDFPQLAADAGRRLQPEQLDRPFVHEQDALLGVQGHDSLYHAAQDHAQLLAVCLKLGKLLSQAFAHVIKAAGECADLVLAGHVDLVAVVAGGNPPGPRGHFLERLGDPSRQPKANDQSSQPRPGSGRPDQLFHAAKDHEAKQAKRTDQKQAVSAEQAPEDA